MINCEHVIGYNGHNHSSLGTIVVTIKVLNYIMIFVYLFKIAVLDICLYAWLIKIVYYVHYN